MKQNEELMDKLVEVFKAELWNSKDNNRTVNESVRSTIKAILRVAKLNRL